VFEIIHSVLAGLVLFLYGIFNLSDQLKVLWGEKAKSVMENYTKNRLTGILLGIITTALLDSSLAVIIIAIIMVNSGILTFRQTIGIVLGANIGTTIGSQIIALNFSKYSPLILLPGLILMMASNKIKIKKTGEAFFLFGILFYGLHVIENAVEPLKNDTFILEWLKKTEYPLQGGILGALITFIIQSSSATVGMCIVMVKKGLLSIKSGIAIMMGAELGTCSDTLIATINGTRQALKTGIFHTFFNLVSILLGLVFFEPFAHIVSELSKGLSPENHMANAHVIFNIMGVLLFFFLIPLIEKILNIILPDIKHQVSA
jgi:phosphate:Na+ symporter